MASAKRYALPRYSHGVAPVGQTKGFMISKDASELIEFLDGGSDRACPLCGGADSQSWVRAHHFHLGGEWVTFDRCRDCGSLFSDVSGNAYSEQVHPGYAKFYAEMGAGVEPIAQMILENRPACFRAFADVGCAIGYSLDLVDRLFGIPVLGLEPNLMDRPEGLRGEILGVPLDRAWLSQDSRRFDLILACEVIEHVDDHVGFATNLRHALMDAMGIVVFSTPDAASIVPGESTSEVFSRLFPGEHRYLFSKAALLATLTQAGYEAVDIVERGGHLVATAGTQAALAGRAQWSAGLGWEEMFERYLREGMRDVAHDGSSIVYAGHAYRLFKSLVNQGKVVQARDWLSIMSPLSPLVDDTGTLREDVLDQGLAVKSFEAYVMQLPSFCGPLAYHLAMLARLEGRFEVAAVGLERALCLMTHEISIGAFCFIESASLIDICRMELALVLHRLGRAIDARGQWQSMCQDEGLALERFVRAGARLAVDANAQADYVTVVHVEEVLAAHPLRSAACMRAWVEGDFSVCSGDDRDLAFNFWVARFYAGLHGENRLVRSQAAHLVLSQFLESWPNARQQSVLNAVREDFVKMRRQVGQRLPEPKPLVHFIDQLWVDLHGVFVKGWVHARGRPIRAVHLVSGSARAQADLHARPDVVKFYPEYPGAGESGFQAYLPCLPFQPVLLEVDVTEGRPLSVPVEVPAHLQPTSATVDTSSDSLERFRVEMKRRGGTVVVVGGRMGELHPDVWADCLLPECRIVRVDIHPGRGVDLVADAHTLSSHFAPGSIDGVISHSVLEHLEAPWIVAAEINRVLRVGGLTLHHAPQTWPLHAEPNDFWRMSENGLKVLFGPSMGFELVDAGMNGSVRMYPSPALRHTRYASIEMPLFDGFLMSHILARKVGDMGPMATTSVVDDVGRSVRAQQYPRH